MFHIQYLYCVHLKHKKLKLTIYWLKSNHRNARHIHTDIASLMLQNISNLDTQKTPEITEI